jgi:hypothetical protein
MVAKSVALLFNAEVCVEPLSTLLSTLINMRIGINKTIEMFLFLQLNALVFIPILSIKNIMAKVTVEMNDKLNFVPFLINSTYLNSCYGIGGQTGESIERIFVLLKST